MKLLAFDTSSTTCSVALLHGEDITARHKIAPMQQTQLILPMVEELFSMTGIHLTDLDAIAFGGGPGSFTGIRIASSVAQGLGLVVKCPIIRISSLAALAEAAFQAHQVRDVFVAVDARMQQIYWANYAVQDGIMQLVGKEEVIAPDAITCPVEKKGYGIGDGWPVYGDRLIKKLGFQPPLLPSADHLIATALVTLAQAKMKNGDSLTPAQAIPIYLR